MESVDLGAVPAHQQTQGPIDLFLIFAGANIVATTLQMGTFLPAFSLVTAMIVITAAALGGAAFVAVLAPIGTSLRVPSIVASRAALGFHGAQIVAFVLFATNFVWIAVNNAIAASITARLIGGAAADHQALLAVALGVIATVTVIGGPRVVGLADRVAVPLLFVSGLALTIACLHATLPPLPSPETSSASVFHGFDIIFGYQTTWLLMFADYSRYSRPGAKAGLATFAGLGLTAVWFIPLGLMASRVAGSGDPGAMIYAIGLGWGGAVLVILGTLTTNFVNIYMSALALKSLRPSTSNAAAVWIIGGIGAVLGIWYAQLLTHLDTFTVLLTGILTPVGGALVAHFVILRRKHAAADLYPSMDGAPPRIGLWSLAGVASWVSGAAVFFIVNDRIGGVIPALVTSIVVYLLTNRKA